MTLRVTNLCKAYPTRGEPLVILRGVDLTLAPGDAAAIMGPSGSGKSTFLHIVGTLDRPTSGSVDLAGTDPFRLSERELAAFRNRRIGFVFQDHHLLPQCSVLENVLIPTLIDPTVNKVAIEEEARRLLERVGLQDRLSHRPTELSGGERQRTAIARALIRKPALLLADEPTGNLDRKTAAEITELLLELHAQEKNILLVVTHSNELAKRLPLRYDMNDGRLAA